MTKVVKRTFSLTLEQAKFIDEKVELGTFASASEVVRDSIRVAQARDEAIERWLRTEVVPAYDRLRRGEAKLLTPNKVREALEERYAKASKAAE